MDRAVRILAVCMSLGLIVGCGQKGSLYLPERLPADARAPSCNKPACAPVAAEADEDTPESQENTQE